MGQWRASQVGVRLSRSGHHLIECPSAKLTILDAYDGSYECETGCDFYRVETEVRCEHGVADEYTYGDFGEFSFLEELLQQP